MPPALRSRPALGLLVAALAFISFLNALPGGFAHDDDAALREHPAVTGALPLTRVFALDFWGHDARRGPSIGTWRPLTTATFALDWRIGGGTPRAFHRTNLGLHVLASVGLLLLLLRLPVSTPAALVAAALFAVHPVHTEAVASIVGRAELLGFSLALGVVALHPRDGPLPRTFQVVAFVAACLAKESSSLLLPLLLVSDVLGGRLRPRTLRHALLAASLGLVLFLRWRALGRVVGFDPDHLGNPLAHAPWLPREASALGLVGHALSLLVVPHPLRADYGAAVVVPSLRPSIDHGVAVGALAALAIVGWRSRRERPVVATAIVWLVVPVMLGCNVLLALPVSFAERFLYLPSAAGVLLLALALERASTRRPIGWALAVALAVGFIGLTVRRNPDWRSTQSLTLATVRDEPRSALFQFNRAVMFLGERRFGDALARCEQVTTLAPRWSTGWGCRAVILERAGRLPEAEAAFRTMRAQPDVRSCQYWYGYARFLARTGRPDAALAELDAMRGSAAYDARARDLRRLLRAARNPQSSRPPGP